MQKQRISISGVCGDSVCACTYLCRMALTCICINAAFEWVGTAVAFA